MHYLAFLFGLLIIFPSIYFLFKLTEDLNQRMLSVERNSAALEIEAGPFEIARNEFSYKRLLNLRDALMIAGVSQEQT